MSENITDTARPLRRANELFTSGTHLREPRLLFDQFWREGELALMFGTSGIGKSLLAVQIADALTRGRPLDGFRMPRGRCNVLYIDLSLREGQFERRYTIRPERGQLARSYGFTNSFFREHLSKPDKICEMIRYGVTQHKIKHVIVDSLTEVKRSYDGVNETMELIKSLRDICGTLGISILVITDCVESAGRDKTIGEHSLRRSRILCSFADSVFAIGSNLRGGAYLVQTRSRHSAIEWTIANAPQCRIQRNDSGMLGFVFDERFSPTFDEQVREMICRIRRLKDGGMTFAAAAMELGISRSSAQRLYKKWTPAMEPIGTPDEFVDEGHSYAYEDQDAEETWPELTANEPIEEETTADEPWMDGGEERPDAAEPLPDLYASARAPKRLIVHDLEHDLDRYGRRIYIQQRSSNGHIQVYYRFDEKRQLIRCSRTLFGWSLDTMPDPPYLDSG